ncbi:hypothetical protein [Streptomyces sp. NPDC088400]|uniref:hypothetical protein n=1 Tax=Streptomyces sp. NPDC088400 TaxID=3365861 RepID=UPI00381ED440
MRRAVGEVQGPRPVAVVFGTGAADERRFTGPAGETPGCGAVPVPTRRSGAAVGALPRCTEAGPVGAAVGSAEVRGRADARGSEAEGPGRPVSLPVSPRGSADTASASTVETGAAAGNLIAGRTTGAPDAGDVVPSAGAGGVEAPGFASRRTGSDDGVRACALAMGGGVVGAGRDGSGAPSPVRRRGPVAGGVPGADATRR